jgi:hypothetical protein
VRGASNQPLLKTLAKAKDLNLGASAKALKIARIVISENVDGLNFLKITQVKIYLLQNVFGGLFGDFYFTQPSAIAMIVKAFNWVTN